MNENEYGFHRKDPGKGWGLEVNVLIGFLGSLALERDFAKFVGVVQLLNVRNIYVL